MKKIGRPFVAVLTVVIVLLLAATFAACDKNPDEGEITGIVLNRNYLSLQKGETYTLLPTLEGGNGEVYYFSANESIAQVSGRGEITAVEQGETVIVAHACDHRALCYVIVEPDEVISKIEAKNGTLKAAVNLTTFGINGNYASPLTVTYNSKNGIPDLGNPLLNLSIDMMNGLPGDEKTALQQTADNLKLLKQLTSLDSGFIFTLANANFPYAYRAYGKSVADLCNANVIADMIDKDRYEALHSSGNAQTLSLALSKTLSVAVTDKNDRLYAFSEGNALPLNVLTYADMFLRVVRSLDFSVELLGEMDWITLLNNAIEDGDLISDETQETIITYSKVATKIVSLLAGGLEIEKTGSETATALSFSVNEKARTTLVETLLSELDKVVPEAYKPLINDFLTPETFSISNVECNVEIVRDADCHTHLKKTGVDLAFTLAEQDMGASFEIAFDTEATTAQENFFEALDAKNNVYSADLVAYNEFIDAVGMAIAINDKGVQESNISLLSGDREKALLLLDKYDDYDDNVKTMIGSFDVVATKQTLENYYGKFSAALDKIDEATTADELSTAIGDLSENASFKAALKEHPETLIHAQTIQDAYLADVETEIASIYTQLVSAISSGEESALLSAIDAFDTLMSPAGKIASVFDYDGASAKFGKIFSISDKQEQKRIELCVYTEQKDENGAEKACLYALSHKAIDAVWALTKLYINNAASTVAVKSLLALYSNGIIKKASHAYGALGYDAALYRPYLFSKKTAYLSKYRSKANAVSAAAWSAILASYVDLASAPSEETKTAWNDVVTQYGFIVDINEFEKALFNDTYSNVNGVSRLINEGNVLSDA